MTCPMKFNPSHQLLVDGFTRRSHYNSNSYQQAPIRSEMKGVVVALANIWSVVFETKGGSFLERFCMDLSFLKLWEKVMYS